YFIYFLISNLFFQRKHQNQQYPTVIITKRGSWYTGKSINANVHYAVRRTHCTLYTIVRFPDFSRPRPVPKLSPGRSRPGSLTKVSPVTGCSRGGPDPFTGAVRSAVSPAPRVSGGVRRLVVPRGGPRRSGDDDDALRMVVGESKRRDQ